MMLSRSRPFSGLKPRDSNTREFPHGSPLNSADQLSRSLNRESQSKLTMLRPQVTSLIKT